MFAGLNKENGDAATARVSTEGQDPDGAAAAERDPTLGIAVEVDRTGEPVNRLVTIGDSLTHGFMSAAIFRTDLSWPAVVAYELGLRIGPEYRYPTYEPPSGPGGLPLDLERLVRGLQEVVGERIDWYEAFRALRYVQARMDDVEDYWERGDGLVLPPTDAPYHNLGVYGADLLDVLLLDADIIAERLAEPAEDDLLAQLVEHDNDRAWRTVLESCRAPDGTARTVLGAARAMGEEGLADGGDGPGIETLVVMLGGNNALGSVVHLDVRWTSPEYVEASPRRRLATKGAYNVWQPAHFQAEWALLVEQLEKIAARHVILATVPQVTIAPIARGWRGKVQRGSRYFPYYVRPWVDDDDFDADRDAHLTDEEARAVDSAIDAYNLTIIDTVRRARRAGRDWYLLDLGGSPRQPRHEAIHRRSGGAPSVVGAVRAAGGAGDARPSAEHPVLRVWATWAHRGWTVLARRGPSDDDRLRDHRPRGDAHHEPSRRGRVQDADGAGSPACLGRRRLRARAGVRHA